jgi:DNA polymerase-1
MAHQRPNMANIPVAKRSPKDNEFEKLSNDINDDMRRLWTARPGYRLVGVDADGIQMRIFAHYVNDERLTNALISGNKDSGSDIHSVHQRALGDVCRSRDDAKTFIYAWLLGAGLRKVAEILHCSQSGAKTAVDSFIGFYPGLAHLKATQIPQDASRGYFVGLDGRYVVVPSEHKVLAGYLQNGEKIIMSRAFVSWHKELRKLGIPFVLRNFIHDEWQTEVPDEEEIAQEVARVQSEALARQTEELGLRCPVIAGKPSFGYTWQETH